ncbi:NAD(P)-dependent oxidoreductase [Sphingosinicella rhizophila]|uniref:NAD(P)-dependent oxidoreductase n=1 Tax=Sphingosinicella rhizophila TaxID=3050082 RepID=A0ABU3Q667_9SPHN|nr:NAD(P)-dependent oxidoreductase [Sphingosinicella sp. GR2756]MDT9598812.1 NAD(P)-dependent oxidoreductase [Sphingosinicella sp. GR2756]
MPERNFLPILFLGAGIMGAPMARNLHVAGFPVRVWNRTRSKLDILAASGVPVAEDLSTLATERRVVIAMLFDGQAVEDVLFEGDRHGVRLLDRMAPGSSLICMSSIPVDTACSHDERCRAHGIHYIDAPVSGGEQAAIAGSLSIMTGGDLEAVDAMGPLFEAMGTTITHIGGAGCGQLAKLANQMIVGVTIGAVAEALLLAKEKGADLPAVRQALLGGFARSEVLKQHGARMIDRDFTPGAHSVTQLKDLRAAGSLARSLHLDLPIASMVEHLFEELCEGGRGALDHSALYLLLEDRKMDERPANAMPLRQREDANEAG